MIWRMEVCSSACRQLRIMVEAFSCPICDFTTKWRGNLHPHIWSIHGGQTFQCTLCDNTFTLKATLQKHIKSVHEGQTCQCLHCGFTFNQKTHLYAHIKSVHEAELPRIIRLFDYSNSWDRIVLFGIRYSLILR